MIRLEAASVVYRGAGGERAALTGVTLEIARGEAVAVIGPNGSGKSSLLGLLSGVVRATSGRVGGEPSRSVVLQRTALDPLLTVRENAVLFARVYGVPAREREARLDELARVTGLGERMDDRVGRLSGGLARRADLLRAMMTGPELLILDEPTAGLDREARAGAIGTILALREQFGVSVVLATHEMNEAERAERVFVLKEGRVIAEGAPAALLEHAGGEVVVRRGSGEAERCSRELAREIASACLASGEDFMVRGVALGDAYDRLVGGEP